MDVEARLLLYVVVISAAASIGFIVFRRAKELATHGVILAVLMLVSVLALLLGARGTGMVMPITWAYAVFGVLPYVGVIAARHAAASRRYAPAAFTMTASALALGWPRHLQREAGILRALASLDRGNASAAQATFATLRASELPGDPERVGDLAALLPPYRDERWSDVLLAVDGAERRSPTVLAVEAQAAAETGDLRRALRAADELAGRVSAVSPSLAQARLAILAAAGRHEFLVEARRKALSVTDTDDGIFRLARARALESAGERALATTAYGEAVGRLRGTRAAHAERGRARCAANALRRAVPDEVEVALLHDLEAACLRVPADPARRPIHRRAPATLVICVVTVLVSIAAFAAFGTGEVGLSAAGALGRNYVVDEGGWGRLATAMLLHGGFIHLALNTLSIVFVGMPYEERMGSVRLVIVYIGSGLFASAASVLIAGTPVGIGASGAAMGLVGALGATAFHQRHLFDVRERRRWIGFVVASVAMNGVIGAVEHHAIDNAAHGGGLVAGAVLAVLLFPRRSSEFGRAARRLTAASLLAVVAMSVIVVGAEIPRWTGFQTARAGGVTCEVPRWVVATKDRDVGTLFSRAPLPFVVQLGRVGVVSPQVQRLLLRLSVDDAPPTDGFKTLSLRGWRDGDLQIEERIVTEAGSTDSDLPEDASPMRVLMLTRGDVFALVVCPPPGSGEDAYDIALARIASTLRSLPGEGTAADGGAIDAGRGGR